MVHSVENLNAAYPDVWIRWVTQQVRIAVSFELTTTNPSGWPHLRRLPLTVIIDGADNETFLRELIVSNANRIEPDTENRIDAVVTAVLADDSVAVAEPDLQTMLAWRLAEHHTMTTLPGDDTGEWNAFSDHECLDPEAVAADLIASGLVAPAWKLDALSALAARNRRIETGTATRRGRRAAVSPLQIAFPL